ncbi:MAG: NDP-sugar synthase, partial [Sulfolobales archaeon]
PKVLRTGRVYAYVHNGIWFDIGIPEDYLKANIAALNALYPSGFVASSSEVRGEVVGPAYIGNEVVVGKGSIIGPNSVLLDQVSVGDFSMVKGSVVMKGSRIGSSTYIKNSVVGESCSIGNWVRIESGTIIGDQVSIADEVFINKRNYILPYKEISESIWNEGGVVL